MFFNVSQLLRRQPCTSKMNVFMIQKSKTVLKAE